MSHKRYDLAVVIGRFQPFHNQHLSLIKHAESLAKLVVILVGGDDRPRTPKNPFNMKERTSLINEVVNCHLGQSKSKVLIVPIRDYLNSDTLWAEHVQYNVNNLVAAKGIVDPQIVLVGCNKDSSSFYLDMFPQWDLSLIPFENKVSATDIREILFNENTSIDYLTGVLPEVTLKWMKEFKKTPIFDKIREEHSVIESYKKAWNSAPYPPTFVTTDAVVLCNGHVLLVQRKAYPGQGLLALPGGFVNQTETIENALIRELKEETKINVPVPVLKGSLKEIKVFDNPDRSSRGRTITHTGLIVLNDKRLPKVKGGDDAARAFWVPLGEVSSSVMFEDHYDQISYFKGQV